MWPACPGHYHAEQGAGGVQDHVIHAAGASSHEELHELQHARGKSHEDCHPVEPSQASPPDGPHEAEGREQEQVTQDGEQAVAPDRALTDGLRDFMERYERDSPAAQPVLWEERDNQDQQDRQNQQGIQQTSAQGCLQRHPASALKDKREPPSAAGITATKMSGPSEYAAFKDWGMTLPPYRFAFVKVGCVEYHLPEHPSGTEFVQLLFDERPPGDYLR